MFAMLLPEQFLEASTCTLRGAGTSSGHGYLGHGALSGHERQHPAAKRNHGIVSLGAAPGQLDFAHPLEIAQIALTAREHALFDMTQIANLHPGEEERAAGIAGVAARDVDASHGHGQRSRAQERPRGLPSAGGAVRWLSAAVGHEVAAGGIEPPPTGWAWPSDAPDALGGDGRPRLEAGANQ